MPEPTTTTPPPDSGTGAPPEGGTGAAGAGTTPPPTTPPPGTTPPKTFTQEEMDAIIGARLAREKPDPEVARKAAEYDKLQEGQKTELQKAQDRADKAEAKAKDAEAKADQTLVRAAIIEQATVQKAADSQIVVALLAGDPTITVEDGEVKGVKEAVAKLLKSKPILAGTAGAASGGQFGGNDQRTIDERIAEAERAGKFGEARDLKIQKGLATR
jgi:hypothetical protein